MKDFVSRIKKIACIHDRRRSRRVPFSRLFQHFRSVLESNSRALEKITDMGETLAGEYLFDINYVRKAYSELSEALMDSISRFGMLTGDKYPGLQLSASRIDDLIKKVIQGTSTSRRELVLFLDDITWVMAGEVGGKAANIAEVRNYLHTLTPDGFILTARACDEFLNYNGIESEIGADVSKEQLHKVRQVVLNGSISPTLDEALRAAIKRSGAEYLAIRSSAQEEDTTFSFAGQFETVLNVPAETDSVWAAYKKVVASLFSEKAVSYRKKFGIPDLKMPVLCMEMVDPVASGVLYSVDPSGSEGTMVINATWGLGSYLVEGQTDADMYVLDRRTLEITGEFLGKKEFMATWRENGTQRVPTPLVLRGQPCVTPEQIRALATHAMEIEKHFRAPQDIEWAIDKKGRLVLLQARALRMGSDTPDLVIPPPELNPPIAHSKGIVVQKGTASGRIFFCKNPDELEHFPQGAVLVSARDSSDFVKIMPYASAILTGSGTATSHMASLCREFRIPAVVNTGELIGKLRDGQEVSLEINEEGVTLYDGIVASISRRNTGAAMDDIYEYRKKRYILKYISPLHLFDPSDGFKPEECRTVHDILRSIHEKSVAELIENAACAPLQKNRAVPLDLPVPAGIRLIDIGGALSKDTDQRVISLARIESIPLKAVLQGMLHPGAWHSEAISVKLNDFLSSMISADDIVSGSAHAVNNLAIASNDYVHLSLKFGYHFTILDAYCSEDTRNNHIYFRFAGGATDIIKRSRRVQLINMILKQYGFAVKVRGDMITARIGGLALNEMRDILDHLGRLMAFTRQLDALLHDTHAVEYYAAKFFRDDYSFV